MSVGPQKIILIRSGRYDYGEVELAGAIQIVGPNNTGKTTLINTLQFLYIDDLRRMDFGSYTPEQTRSYYFPDQYSYMLFECLGAHGKCVIGWRGSSRASGGEAERLSYEGPYDPADFMDEGSKVREPRDVNGRLALKGFRVIKSAQEHRELLLPAGAAHDRGLGIVLLKDSDKYHQFRETLKNLLTLSTLTQDQMRDRLLMFAEIPPDRIALDARQLFGEDYDRIRLRREKLRKFKQQQGSLELLVKRFEERERVRGELVFRWTDLRTKRIHFEKEHTAKLEKLAEEARTSTEKIQKLTEELKDRREQIQKFSESKGGLEAQLSEIERAGKGFADFIEEFERAAVAQLKQRISALELQLSLAQSESRDRIDQKLSQARAQLEHKEKSIARFDSLLVTEMRKHFPDESIEQLFRLLNRDLLEYPVSADGVDIRDVAALKQAIQKQLERFENNVYRDETLAIHFENSAGAARNLSALPNVENLRKEVAELQAGILKLEEVVRAIQEREALVAQRQALSQELEVKTRQIIQFENFQGQKAAEPHLRAELKQITESITAATKSASELEQAIRGAETRERNGREGMRHAETGYRAVMTRFEDCIFPAFNSKPLETGTIPNDFDAAIALYIREQTHQEKLRGDVESILRTLELHFGDEFSGQDEYETMANLHGELEALGEKEDALTRDWNAHVHGLKAAFDGVLKELGHIKSAADELNRHFARVQVSNLKQLRIEVLEQGDTVSWLKKLADLQQPGLFDEDTRVEPTLRNFRQKLEGNPLIRYADMFSLGFTVVGSDERKHTYHDFKQIESHGTTITIKVLFNLLLLKSQLRKEACHVPFFLDEIQALDPANRSAILNTARKMGFVAITAAPDSVSEVDSLYFLQPQKGRIVLRNKHRIKIKLGATAVA